MTDQTIPADDVREIIGKMRYHANHDNVRGTEEEYVRFFASQLEDLLPTPTPPTLADMTKEERRDCEWMQCDVAGLGGAWLIIDPFDDEDHVHVIGRKGDSRILPAHFITPRPDLPGMEWTGSKRPDPAPALPDGWRLADHEENGRVIVTNPTPSGGDRAYYVIPAADRLGFDWFFCHADELTYLD